MTEHLLIATSPDWFRATAWALGMPVVIALVVIGTFAIAQRYSGLIAGASPELNPFGLPWFTRRQHLRGRIALAIALTIAFPIEFQRWSLTVILTILATYLLVWSIGCIVSKRAKDLPSRVYCAGLIAMAGFISLMLYVLHQLRPTA